MLFLRLLRGLRLIAELRMRNEFILSNNNIIFKKGLLNEEVVKYDKM